MSARRPFLTARWQDLILAQYRVPPDLLRHRLPRGFGLDLWQGEAFVSLVAFRFLDARVMGVRWVFHTNFPEVNLRFYAVAPDGRRGVVFVREYVPRLAIGLVARTVYNEPYRTAPMTMHREHTDALLRLRYTLGRAASLGTIEASAAETPSLEAEGTPAHHFKEHEWGFGVDRRGGALSYQVRHSRWRTHAPVSNRIEIDWKRLYGAEWGFLSGARPDSVIIAEGSAVEVDPFHSHD
ncbi:MAG: DUF2071 domain-containing protein [Planctomycetes bacterium]|nr:DUF2071 domain-containing protein [Planctomycetota bacterium]